MTARRSGGEFAYGATEDGRHECSETAVDDLIRWRLEQTNVSRLCEYVTGLCIDDPALTDRLLTDQAIIRGKYGLPDGEVVYEDPAWYDHFLRTRIEKAGVEVMDKSNCGAFFRLYPHIGAVFFEKEWRMGIDIDKSDGQTYACSLIELEHEFIHVVQNIKAPSMPIEAWEYEAYLAVFNTDVLRNNPRAIDFLFLNLIGVSVKLNYDEKSVEAGTRVVPEWIDPDYFLINIDKVYPDQLTAVDGSIGSAAINEQAA